MFTKKKNAVFGRYPCCDMINNAIRFIIDGKSDSAVEELLQTIWKADGYVHEDIANKVDEIHNRIWGCRLKTNYKGTICAEECQPELNDDTADVKSSVT